MHEFIVFIEIGRRDLHYLCWSGRPSPQQLALPSVADRRVHAGHGGRVLHPYRARRQAARVGGRPLPAGSRSHVQEGRLNLF